MINGQSCITVGLVRGYDANLDRLGAHRKEFQRLGADLRALLGRNPRRDVGRQPIEQTGGKNLEPPGALARRSRGGC
jgi:hypothetical protein